MDTMCPNCYEIDDGALEDWAIEQGRRERRPAFRSDFTPEDFETDDPEAARAARRSCRTDHLAPRSAATILGPRVDVDEHPDAMAAFILAG